MENGLASAYSSPIKNCHFNCSKKHGTDKWRDGPTGGRKEGGRDGQEGWTDGLTDERTDGGTDGWN